MSPRWCRGARGRRTPLAGANPTNEVGYSRRRYARNDGPVRDMLPGDHGDHGPVQLPPGSRSGVALGPAAILDAGCRSHIGCLARRAGSACRSSGWSRSRGPSGLLSEPLWWPASIGPRSRSPTRSMPGGSRCCSPVIVRCSSRGSRRSTARAAVQGSCSWTVTRMPGALPPPLTGEASDCEMGLALGDTRLPEGLAFQHPATATEDTAFLGPRDRQEIQSTPGGRSVADRVPFVDGPTSGERPDRSVVSGTPSDYATPRMGGGSTSISTCCRRRRLGPSTIRSPEAFRGASSRSWPRPRSERGDASARAS